MFSKKLVGTLGAGSLPGSASAAPAAQAATSRQHRGQQRGRVAPQRDLRRRGHRRPDEIEFEIPGNGVHTITLAERPAGRHQAADDPRLLAAGRRSGDAGRARQAEGRDRRGQRRRAASTSAATRSRSAGSSSRTPSSTASTSRGGNNVIAGNYIGTNAAGDAARPNGLTGVDVVGQDNVIGGPDPEDRNVISGNGVGRVDVTDGSGHVIEGNQIGTNAAGKRRTRRHRAASRSRAPEHRARQPDRRPVHGRPRRG